MIPRKVYRLARTCGYTWSHADTIFKPPATTDNNNLTAYPTPSTGSSSTTGRSSVPPVPLLRLPMLAMRTTLLPGVPILSSPSSSNTPSSSSIYSSSAASSAYRTAGSGSAGSGSTSSLVSGLQTPSTRSSGVASTSSARLLFANHPGSQLHGDVDDPFLTDGAAVDIKPAPKPGSIEARRQAMQDRVSFCRLPSAWPRHQADICHRFDNAKRAPVVNRHCRNR